jgi:anti-sigma factor RsiW
VYSSTSTAMNAGRIREFREQAATDRLVLQARRARREAAAAQASLRRRPWPRWWTRRAAAAMTAQRVPADATPDQWASALSVAAAQVADHCQ